MFAYIKGTLEHKTSDYVVVDTGNIGYKVYTAMSTLSNVGDIGMNIKLYTHLYVREDNMSIYGFLTQEELGVFELLLTVSGVGPKVALSMLSAVSPSKFSLAVIMDDAKLLTKAQGVGNKVAQRIILELKDKLKKEQLNVFTQDETPSSSGSHHKLSEAVSALMVLGYNHFEANKAIMSVYDDDKDIEDIIKGALMGLSRS